MNRWQLCGSWILIGILWIVFFPMSAAGQLLVTDRVSNQILEYNLDGSFRRALVPPSYPTLFTPSGLALGNGYDLYVANENTSDNTYNVQRYDWRTGENLGGFDLGLNGPGGLLFDRASSTLYVSDFGGHQIVKYNTSTGEKTWLDAGAEVNGLADMALGQDGNLYVSNFWDGTVLRFNPTAQIFASAPSTSTNFIFGANGLAFDPSGNLVVAEMLSYNNFGIYTGGGIYKFDGSGTLVPEFVPISGNGLKFPSDIVIDPDGNLLVSNMGDDKATPPTSGYIGKYNLTTGAAIDQNFITFSGSTLVQPAAMQIEPYGVWTGGAVGINFWTNAANWGGTAPVDPAAVRFGAVAGGHVGNNNDFAAGTTFNGITFAADAPKYTLQGNAIKLNGPVINQSANDQEIDLAMELLDLGGSFDTGGQKLTVGGLISGAGSLAKKGAGTLSLVGGVSYSGSTTVTDGTLDIAGPLCNSPTIDVEGADSELLAQSIVADTLTIGAGATVEIKAIPGGPLCLQSIQAVPEPGTVVLLPAAGLLVPLVFLPRRRKT